MSCSADCNFGRLVSALPNNYLDGIFDQRFRRKREATETGSEGEGEEVSGQGKCVAALECWRRPATREATHLDDTGALSENEIPLTGICGL